ncbi:hypothetical protein BDR07DRAFT_1048141 [Suillus spraguei]|nr:hypothetical protein BDR07DRAFT_1048141 [Suillus spraguei]
MFVECGARSSLDFPVRTACRFRYKRGYKTFLRISLAKNICQSWHIISRIIMVSTVLVPGHLFKGILDCMVISFLLISQTPGLHSARLMHPFVTISSNELLYLLTLTIYSSRRKETLSTSKQILRVLWDKVAACRTNHCDQCDKNMFGHRSTLVLHLEQC